MLMSFEEVGRRIRGISFLVTGVQGEVLMDIGFCGYMGVVGMGDGNSPTTCHIGFW
jgi:hypothetical protein